MAGAPVRRPLGLLPRTGSPRNAEEAHLSLDALFDDTRRVYFANRGVWDAIATSGPHLGFAHGKCVVDDYLSVLDEFLDELA